LLKINFAQQMKKGASEIKRLSDLAIGHEATLIDFKNEESKNQLMEMGCIPGIRIKREYDAPFGDPICVAVSGYFLMIRKAEAEMIIVEE